MPARVPPEEGPPTGVDQGPPRTGVWTSGLQRAAEHVIVVLCHSALWRDNDAAGIVDPDRATIVVELDLGAEGAPTSGPKTGRSSSSVAEKGRTGTPPTARIPSTEI